ncbi:MAG TPA: class I SAM-dependent methyltransferase [Steroidobacteraceae bacterium]|nr:class I SAM-dependent methyltransferase [Steroidobacteraceae bacterium]
MNAAEHDEFVKYYEAESALPETVARFQQVKRAMENLLAANPRDPRTLDVLDVGCGAATQCILWARDGYRMHGLDINEKLIEIGIRRSREAGVATDLRAGSATQLPWADQSMDVCLAPELLEHVPDWNKVLDECARVLRPGGLLYLSTTNRLCPVQSEFDLPFYSWYPQALKRRYERLAVTTRPELVSHATYPAVNWFTFGSLAQALQTRGLRAVSRYQAADLAGRGTAQRMALTVLKSSGLARWLAGWLTPSTIVFGFKSSR